MGTRWREGGAGNMDPLEGPMTDVSKSETISTKQQRIANLARRMPNRPLHALSHHIDIHWMRRAYQLTRMSASSRMISSATMSSLTNSSDSAFRRAGRFRVRVQT